MKDKRKWLVGGGITLIIILGILVIHQYYPDFKLGLPLGRIGLRQLLRHHGPVSAVILILLTAAMTAVPGVSSSIVCVFNGVAYGPIIGFLMNIIGMALGNGGVIMTLDRLPAQDKSRSRINLQATGYPGMTAMLGYMIPVIPSVLVSYAAVKARLQISKIIMAVVGGSLPTAFLYAFGGDALLRGNYRRLLVVGGGLLILIAGVLLFHRFHHTTRWSR
ncbi:MULTISPECIES: TVP38/TMEM64 family protein [unclassified Ligilactobacillus]|uniref:TVP38/TMEM64 family protein n=1 Tax=unclassified Ligilactobacillus TaxID=2767920 RepID=UPI003852D134